MKYTREQWMEKMDVFKEHIYNYGITEAAKMAKITNDNSMPAHMLEMKKQIISDYRNSIVTKIEKVVSMMEDGMIIKESLNVEGLSRALFVSHMPEDLKKRYNKIVSERGDWTVDKNGLYRLKFQRISDREIVRKIALVKRDLELGLSLKEALQRNRVPLSYKSDPRYKELANQDLTLHYKSVIISKKIGLFLDEVESGASFVETMKYYDLSEYLINKYGTEGQRIRRALLKKKRLDSN